MKLARIGYLVLIAGFVTSLSYAVGSANAESIEGVRKSPAEVMDVTVHNGTVHGKVVNKSNSSIEDVKLLVRNIWMWNNEYRPGRDTHSTAKMVDLDGTIGPGQSKDFTIDLNLPKVPHGHFDTKVIVGEYRTVPAA
jgi:hypothetical protein